MFSLMFLLVLNKITRAIPELVSKPAIILPKEIELAKYNLVITILEAQLGIRPIKLVISGLKILSFRSKLLK